MDRAKLREDLVAYVDGELPAAAAREIETWLAADPEAQELRRHLQEDVVPLRGLFSAALREPVPAALSAGIGARRSRRRRPVARWSSCRTARPRPIGRGLQPRRSPVWCSGNSVGSWESGSKVGRK